MELRRKSIGCSKQKGKTGIAYAENVHNRVALENQDWDIARECVA